MKRRLPCCATIFIDEDSIRECKSGDCTYFFVNDMLLHLPNISVGLSTNFVEIYLQFFKIVLQLCLHINVQIV